MRIEKITMFAKNGPMEANKKKSGPAKESSIITLEVQLRSIINQHSALNKRLEWRVIKDLYKLQPYQQN